MSHGQSSQHTGPGCFGYGCLIATVIFCVVMGSVWFFGLRSMRSAVQQYTVPSSQAFPPLPAEAGVASTASSKLNELRSALRSQQPFTAEFSADEVQALIGQTPWRNWLRVSFSGEDVSLKFAFPLSALGDWVAASFLVGDIKERALVGTAQGRFSLQDAKPKLSFSELTLNEKMLEDLPRGHAAEWIVGAISNEIASSKADSGLSSSLKGLHEIVVKDSRLVVTVRP